MKLLHNKKKERGISMKYQNVVKLQENLIKALERHTKGFMDNMTDTHIHDRKSCISIYHTYTSKDTNLFFIRNPIFIPTIIEKNIEVDFAFNKTLSMSIELDEKSEWKYDDNNEWYYIDFKSGETTKDKFLHFASMENYRLGYSKDLLRVELFNNGVTFKIRLIAENPIKTKCSIDKPFLF